MKTTAQEITRVAKTRHQLTSLLIDAQRNKDELEDRIAAAKLNRRAGARNYGF
ncbi:hypothetical protein BT69DRAFT_1276490 [Atractiella rhizophila]|nr:hypothetical protein BT69DRAFT_1276490 [Atractiella rhizophila]